MHTKVEDGTNTFGINYHEMKSSSALPSTQQEFANVAFDAINTFKAVHNIYVVANVQIQLMYTLAS